MYAVMTDDWIARHPLTVDEYYRMAEAGLLAPDARVELIEGEIIDMAPIGDRHGGVESHLHTLLTRAVGELAIVRGELPVRLSEYSEPQPDLAIVKFRDDYYKSRHPTADDTLLIIEISQTTLRYDREIKVPLYARHGVPEVWILDLNGNQLLVHRSPSMAAGTYQDVSVTTCPGKIEITSLPGVALDLAGVLDL